MRKLIPAIVVVLTVVAGSRFFGLDSAEDSGTGATSAFTSPTPGNSAGRANSSSQPGQAGSTADSPIATAYSQHVSNLQVQGGGVVDRVLSDDSNGDRHQRFIVRLPWGQTVLVAHNIDLAPRVAQLSVGDRVDFFGEYEWNAQGGVIHWTHRDPAGRHVAGWIRHDGALYQ